MNTELEDTVSQALRARAGEVPHTPMPLLGAATTAPARPRRGWMVPVAAAGVVLLAVGAAVLLGPGGDDGPSQKVDVAQGVIAPGEVYYSLHLSAAGAGSYVERQVWQPQDPAADWKVESVIGQTIKDGRVVPGDGKLQSLKGECEDGTETEGKPCPGPAGWFNPTPEFLAVAPRDPAVIKQQLHDAAVAEEQKRTAPGGGFSESSDSFSDANLAYLELNYLRGLLASNGVPVELSAALHQVIQDLPAIEVKNDVANLTGQRGTAYTLYDHKNQPLTVIFDAQNHYLGSPQESVHHGVAPAVGQPPSRMLD
jgi:hypothetical protein